MQNEEATRVLQEHPTRPQSNDGRDGETRGQSLSGQAFVASAPAPLAVTLDEVGAAGAKAVPDMEESSKDEAMAVDEDDVEAMGA